MEGLKFSKNKKRKRLSHYKISYSNDKGAFNDSNHIDTIKPETMLGFEDKDGVVYPNLISYLKAREQKQEKIKQDEIEKDEEVLGK